MNDYETMSLNAARDGLIDFMIVTNPVYEPNWHHEIIAEELEKLERDGDKDIKVLMVFMPPRSGKSELCSIGFPAWYLGRNPTKEIITVSYSSELAQDFGSKTRSIVSGENYPHIFPVTLKSDEMAKAKWKTKQGGSYTSVGVGGAVTGRGANFLLFDDPIKNREEAESQTYRDKVWQFFTSCFVAGTPVLMADGTWKSIEDVATGDKVMSYDEKKRRMVVNKVKNVGKQRKDDIYGITTMYGEIECTGEHPFLVTSLQRTGRYLGLGRSVWKKAKELKPGDKVFMTLAGAPNGAARRKRMLESRTFVPRDFWWLAGFILGDGFLSKYKVGIALGLDEKLNKYLFSLCNKFFGKSSLTKKKAKTKEGLVVSIHCLFVYSKRAVDMLLHLGLDFSNAKEKKVPMSVFRQPFEARRAFLDGFLSADGHRMGKRWTIGQASKQLRNDIRLLAMSSGFVCGRETESEFVAKVPGSKKPFHGKAFRLHLRKLRKGFYLSKVKRVVRVRKDFSYNLEVENTHTFVANGFIVHNTAFTRLEPGGVIVVVLTRWHVDDLAGRILENDELGKRTKVVHFPAIATQDEKHRKNGEALWKNRYDLKALEEIKNTIGPYDWEALYQGSPVLTENQEFRPEWYKYITEKDLAEKDTSNYLTVDTAMSKSSQADYTGFVDNSVDKENFWNIKGWHTRLGPEELVDNLFALHERRKYTTIGIERTAYLDGLKPFLEGEQRKRGKFLPIVDLKHAQTSKEIRIRGLIPRYSSGSIRHVVGECRELEQEQSVFPQGLHDDILDACLTAETVVLCKRGQIPIQDVKVGDMVMTRKGYRKVTASWCTGTKPVVTNLGLTGTSNHPVITKNGVTDLINGRESDTLYIWNEKLSCIEEKTITDTQNRKDNNTVVTTGDTTKQMNHPFHFTDRFGLTTLVKSLRNIMFTTKMKIHLIMTQIISNSFLLQTTPNFTQGLLKEGNKQVFELPKTWRVSTKKEGHGEKLPKGLLGTNNMQKLQFLEKKKRESAQNVGVSTKQELNRKQSIVERNVIHEGTHEISGRKTQIITKKPVYNLEVQGEHEYFANNILVHNCAYQLQIADGAHAKKSFIHRPMFKSFGRR